MAAKVRRPTVRPATIARVLFTRLSFLPNPCLQSSARTRRPAAPRALSTHRRRSRGFRRGSFLLLRRLHLPLAVFAGIGPAFGPFPPWHVETADRAEPHVDGVPRAEPDAEPAGNRAGYPVLPAPNDLARLAHL